MEDYGLGAVKESSGLHNYEVQMTTVLKQTYPLIYLYNLTFPAIPKKPTFEHTLNDETGYVSWSNKLPCFYPLATLYFDAQ